MMLMPNLYQLCGRAYGSHQNVYALAFPESQTMLLFDTGLDEADRDIILQNLSDWGLAEYRITHVFLTHSHFDHTGNAHWFAAQGAQILISGPDADAVLNGTAGTINYAYGKDFPSSPVHRTLTNQNVIKINTVSIHCHSVPGHTPGCMVYSFRWNEKTVFVTGDFLQTGDTVYTPELGVLVDERYNYDDYRESLKKMSQFSCDVILPGHYQPCMKNAHILLGAGYREILMNRNRYQYK